MSMQPFFDAARMLLKYNGTEWATDSATPPIVHISHFIALSISDHPLSANLIAEYDKVKHSNFLRPKVRAILQKLIIDHGLNLEVDSQ